LGIKSARPDVLLDDPQVQAAASFIRQEPLGYGRKEASADSLTSAWWDDVEIIQVRAIGWMLVRKSAREADQLNFCLRENHEEWLLRLLRKSLVPQSRAFVMDPMV
jgi:hypothetical protein